MFSSLLPLLGILGISISNYSTSINYRILDLPPDGVLEEKITPAGSIFSVLKITNDMNEEDKRDLEELHLSMYDDITLISPATQKYNCHSYAFLDQKSTNQYWIEKPDVYLTDGSYILSNGLSGDRVVYYKNSTIIHSGIVGERIGSFDGTNKDPDIKDLSNVIIYSKRGKSGVFEHLGDNCLYAGDNYFVDCATSIKYYRLANHTHSYTYTWLDYKNHLAECNCMNSMTQGHFVAGGSFASGKRYANCLRCGGLADMGFIINPMSLDLSYEEIDGLYYVKDTCFVDGVLNLDYKDYLYFLCNNL